MAGTAAVAASLSLCGVATSQQADGTPAAGSNTYLNDQVQLGDVIAGQTLNVQQASTGASAVTTSVANAVSAGATNADLAFQSSQAASGSVAANTSVLVNGGGLAVPDRLDLGDGQHSDRLDLLRDAVGDLDPEPDRAGRGRDQRRLPRRLCGHDVGGRHGPRQHARLERTNTGVINATSNQSSYGGVTAVNTADRPGDRTRRAIPPPPSPTTWRPMARPRR